MSITHEESWTLPRGKRRGTKKQMRYSDGPGTAQTSFHRRSRPGCHRMWMPRLPALSAWDRPLWSHVSIELTSWNSLLKLHVVKSCSVIPKLSLFSQTVSVLLNELTFRHRASYIQDRRFATLQKTLFIYLINKNISLSDICLTVHHWYK